MKSDTRVAVIIPAYNEGSTIADIVSRCLRYVGRVIVVNDGSTDDTALQLKQLPVTLVNNEINMGKGKSICIGVQVAMQSGVEKVITLDGDGQHRPEDIPRLLVTSAEFPRDIIIAARVRDRQAAPMLRRVANGIADFWISWAAGYRIVDSQSGFRLYPVVLFEQCKNYQQGFAFESEVLIEAAQHGIYSMKVEIETIYLQGARLSHYRPAKDTYMIIRMVAKKLLVRGLYPVGLLRVLGLVRSIRPTSESGVIK